MRPHIQPVDRLQRAGISHFIGNDLRLMNMSKSHIIKAGNRKRLLLDWYMLLVSAMGQQNMISRPVERPDLIVKRFSDLTMLITQPVNPRIQ